MAAFSAGELSKADSSGIAKAAVFAAAVAVAVALVAAAIRLGGASQSATPVTPFGGSVSVHVAPAVPLEYERPTPQVRYRLRRVCCAAGAAPGASCFTTLP